MSEGVLCDAPSLAGDSRMPVILSAVLMNSGKSLSVFFSPVPVLGSDIVCEDALSDRTVMADLERSALFSLWRR